MFLSAIVRGVALGVLVRETGRAHLTKLPRSTDKNAPRNPFSAGAD
jgi:hypothetical protein